MEASSHFCCGWRADEVCSISKAYQTSKEVYKTNAATTTVKIKPGTRPRIEYDQGKDMIAKQMYSENSRAAVWGVVLVCPIERYCKNPWSGPVRGASQENILWASCKYDTE